MTGLDLRPLSLGEILDRTFTIYRNYFLLFFGITALPRLLVLAIQLPQLWLSGYSPNRFQITTLTGGLITLVLAVVSVIAYLYSQGGTVFAISEIYLGRSITIGQALGRMKGNVGTLFGVALLNGLAVLGAGILLIIPGIYVACRLMVCVTSALIEDRGPRDSLSRSWDLTQGFAGRSFMIGLLYFVIAFAAGMIFQAPFTVGLLVSLKNPSLTQTMALGTIVGAQIATILTQPIILIATAIFYYDLRVRKEAFDLQFMMNPTGPLPSGPGSVPSIL
jgi:hypothetical protein